MIKKEEELFDEWKKERPGFVGDGIVQLDNYLESDFKILYLLKEVNGGKNWDLRDLLKKGERKPTWDNIALWTFGINNLSKNYLWAELKELRSKEFRIEQLLKIAAINLKKESGSHTANNKIIWGYAKEDQLFLKKQIELYDPKIIVCCGTPTGDILKKVNLVEEFDKWKLSFWGVRYHVSEQNIIIISYCHPEARIDDNFKYFPLINTIREIKKSLK